MHRTLPDFESPIYTPQRISAVVATLAEDGIGAAELLAGSNLEEPALLLPQTRVSYRQVATVFRNAERLAPDSAFALRAGSRMHVTAYGMYGYALLSSRTGAQGLDFSVKYRRVMGPMADLIYSHEADPSSCSFEVLLTSDPNDALYRLALEFTFAAHLTIMRDMYGKGFDYTALRVVYPAPSYAQAYRRWLGCPAQFGHTGNELHFDAAWADRPPRLHDAVTYEMAREVCCQMLTEVHHAGGIASLVRRALVEQMPWRFPSIEAMAKELSMEPRTLRRRLESQGTSYRQVLAEVRQGLAIEFLRKTRMTTEEIASRLGYSDAANFRHAFVRWTGKTPHEYRGT